jgi:hypothetical protein
VALPVIAHEMSHRINDLKDLWLRDMIVDAPALTSILNQPGITQQSQLLRDIRLPLMERRFQMAYTHFTVAQQVKNCQPRWVCQGFHKLS